MRLLKKAAARRDGKWAVVLVSRRFWGGDIRLELPIPSCGIELHEPVAEGAQLLAGKLLDGILDLSDRAHVRMLA
jgi:hypothetical protein